MHAIGKLVDFVAVGKVGVCGNVNVVVAQTQENTFHPIGLLQGVNSAAFHVINVPKGYIVPKLSGQQQSCVNEWFPIAEADLNFRGEHHFFEVDEANDNTFCRQFHLRDYVAHEEINFHFVAPSLHKRYLLVREVEQRKRARKPVGNANFPLLLLEIFVVKEQSRQGRFFNKFFG